MPTATKPKLYRLPRLVEFHNPGRNCPLCHHDAAGWISDALWLSKMKQEMPGLGQRVTHVWLQSPEATELLGGRIWQVQIGRHSKHFRPLRRTTQGADRLVLDGGQAVREEAALNDGEITPTDSGEFLEQVVSSAAAKLRADPSLASIPQGLSAAAEIGRRNMHSADASLMLRLTAAIGKSVAAQENPDIIEGTVVHEIDEPHPWGGPDEEVVAEIVEPDPPEKKTPSGAQKRKAKREAAQELEDRQRILAEHSAKLAQDDFDAPEAAVGDDIDEDESAEQLMARSEAELRLIGIEPPPRRRPYDP